MAALWAAPLSSAYALDKDQIISMSEAGIGAGAIKGAIDGADEELELDEDDIGELRAAGVDDEIIEYLEATGHLDDDVDEEVIAATPAEGDGDDGPAPSPAPDEEEEDDLTTDQTRKLIEQEDERRRALSRQANRFRNAERDLQAGAYMDAAQVYLGFLDLELDEGLEQIDSDLEGEFADEIYEANWGLARALYEEGILSGAATPLLEVVMEGAQRPHFKDAFYMLEDLTRRIGFQPPELEELTKVYVGDMNDDFRHDFNYYLGKFFFDYGRYDLAVDYLDKVAEGAEDYPEALYLKGVSQLEQEGETGEALRNFERAILAGEAEPGGNEEILQLGYLALARVFYEVGYYDVALYYYQKVPSESARHADATFETAWTYFMKNDFKRALGTFHTLDSPLYDEWYFPDRHILEATVYLNLCQYDKSKETLAHFEEEYLDRKPDLEEFLQETTEPKAYWKAITGIYKDNPPEEAEGLPQMFANSVLDELSFYNIYEVIKTLRQERDALKANIDGLGEFGEHVLANVEEQLDTKIEEGGILVQQKLSEVNDELTEWDLSADQILFDIESAEVDDLQRQLQNRDTEQVADEGTTLLIVADDFTPWPFEGEYWLDEVDNYRSRLQSQCASR